ncbi:hypothetical protein D9611_001039 [Ephemerocybe angulata]|uniref:AAA+ ATPase domain-containing protein n=1 Tax=Ephemerocybe angulata TaxID=980116 RepID=A0A8H5F6V6_9AGAR|nr:hypothetical protein D9611_001039 [Tulosesus angulatus]
MVATCHLTQRVQVSHLSSAPPTLSMNDWVYLLPLEKSSSMSSLSKSIIIPVLGPTGAGKSFFINKLLEETGNKHPGVTVGVELDPCTRELKPVTLTGLAPKHSTLSDRQVIVVDTPGLEDQPDKDLGIIKSIASYLEHSLQKGAVLGGVVYLHDVSQDRVAGNAQRTLNVLNELCKAACLSKAALVTTKWGRGHGRDFGAREKELKEKHWRFLIDGKARVMRFEDERKGTGALKVVESLLSMSRDIAVLLLGESGAGKSTFINAFLKEVGLEKRVLVGYGQSSCTASVEAIPIDGETKDYEHLKEHKLVVVDTPGFNDTGLADKEILEKIARWLEHSYEQNMVLGGVIFLYDITLSRFAESARQTRKVLVDVCGEEALSRVVMVTSKWERELKHSGQEATERKEQELQDNYWKSLLQPATGGATMMRWNGDKKGEMPRDIVCSILERVNEKVGQSGGLEPLLIQKEMARGTKYSQTRAGSALSKDLSPRAWLERLRGLFTRIL